MTLLLVLGAGLAHPTTRPVGLAPQLQNDANVPTQVIGDTGDMTTGGDVSEFMCGSSEMDSYFNEHCNGAVGSIVAQCCDEDAPGYQECAIFQGTCISAHVASGECDSEQDCAAGCRFFNAIQASCCARVEKSKKTAALASQEEQKRIPEFGPGGEPYQLCETESNLGFFENLCGKGSVRKIARDCCGDFAEGWKADQPGPAGSQSACEEHTKACGDAQIVMQVKDSCCPRPAPPSPPSTDLNAEICGSDEAQGFERLAFKRPDRPK